MFSYFYCLFLRDETKIVHRTSRHDDLFYLLLTTHTSKRMSFQGLVQCNMILQVSNQTDRNAKVVECFEIIYTKSIFFRCD